MINQKIGFFYINDPNWIGGMDYVINAVNSLCYLPIEEQPEIEIIVSKEVDINELRNRINYRKYGFYMISTKSKSNIGNWLINKFKWKYVYPFPKGRIYDNIFWGLEDKRKVYWIPDFQEEYFSHLFREDELEKRRKIRSSLSKQTKSVVVFSSQNAHKDFQKFFGPKILAKTKILHFANPDSWKFNEEFTEQTLTKYNLATNKFFICPNQMWEHKNHETVFEAIRVASRTNQTLKIVFCGKEHDSRNPNFVMALKKSATDLVEKENVYFLGFLPKDEQMCLIKESIALIQPSKFEGWSTTIEDGISLGKRVIASNLGVNVEQLGNKGYFFNPENHLELTNKLLNLAGENIQVDYGQEFRIKEFARNLIALLD